MARRLFGPVQDGRCLSTSDARPARLAKIFLTQRTLRSPLLNHVCRFENQSIVSAWHGRNSHDIRDEFER